MYPNPAIMSFLPFVRSRFFASQLRDGSLTSSNVIALHLFRLTSPGLLKGKTIMPSRSRSPDDLPRSRTRSPYDSRSRSRSRSLSRRRSPSRDSRTPPRRNGRARDSRSRSRSRSYTREDSRARSLSRGRGRSRSESPLRSTKVCRRNLTVCAVALADIANRLSSSDLPRTLRRIIYARSSANTARLTTWTCL